jgi:hypothetical protein
MKKSSAGETKSEKSMSERHSLIIERGRFILWEIYFLCAFCEIYFIYLVWNLPENILVQKSRMKHES